MSPLFPCPRSTPPQCPAANANLLLLLSVHTLQVVEEHILLDEGSREVSLFVHLVEVVVVVTLVDQLLSFVVVTEGAMKAEVAVAVLAFLRYCPFLL